MTREATVRVQCDDCGTKRTAQVGVPVEKLRASLRDVGWACGRNQDFDVCPTCVSARRARGLPVRGLDDRAPAPTGGEGA